MNLHSIYKKTIPTAYFVYVLPFAYRGLLQRIRAQILSDFGNTIVKSNRT